MSFDGIVTRAITNELNEKILNGRINKINQPENRVIVIQIYNNKKNYKLLLDASSNKPGFYLTNSNKENPLKAPNFCMLLRKHLQNGVIVSINQKGLDRVVNINISSMNELGDMVLKTITVEVMGKYSNIILRQGYKIIDSITRVTEDISRVRQLLPGLNYSYIEDNKIDITKELKSPSTVISNLKKDLKLSKFFYMNYTGFSPQLTDEILFKSNIDKNTNCFSLNDEQLKKLDSTFNEVVKNILFDRYHPSIYRDKTGKIIDFHSLKMDHFMADVTEEKSISMAADTYFSERFLSDKISQKVSSLSKKLNNLLDKNRNKLIKLKDEKEFAEKRDIFKIYGDVLSSNIHSVNKGDTSVKLENFYDPDLSMLEIPLDNKKSPWENAQHYYKKYSKLKTSANLLKKQIPNLTDDIKYLEQVLDSLKKVENDSEIEEIKHELSKQNYIKQKKNKKKIHSPKLSSPHHFINKRNKHFYVGKNNYQNDYITLKLANKEDIFIHVKDVPGSHVILRNENITKLDILDGCYLAAKYSSVSNEQNVAVDYTEKKNVRKSKGAKPGMVYYENYSTEYVNPKDFNYGNLSKIK
ncbi:MAG: NFACT RNA binding domain-containing protein [Lagierella massiliensis]|nr:NFACT RNA binding domain-containing protein [Lagierella massiliensis]